MRVHLIEQVAEKCSGPPGMADHPTQATNLITMKMPTAMTAVSAQDIPTRIAI
jgi:hypothetical protein